MEGPLPREEKQRWFDRLCAVQNGISEELHRQYVGQTLRCLVDGESDDARWLPDGPVPPAAAWSTAPATGLIWANTGM